MHYTFIHLCLVQLSLRIHISLGIQVYSIQYRFGKDSKYWYFFGLEHSILCSKYWVSYDDMSRQSYRGKSGKHVNKLLLNLFGVSLWRWKVHESQVDSTLVQSMDLHLPLTFQGVTRGTRRRLQAVSHTDTHRGLNCYSLSLLLWSGNVAQRQILLEQIQGLLRSSQEYKIDSTGYKFWS